jgi:hypothetical protein
MYNYDHLDFNSIGDQGMIYLVERQLPLHTLSACNNLLYAGQNNIAAEGLRLMPNCNFLQLKQLDLSNSMNYLGWNKIGGNGIKMLAKANMPELI